MIVLQLEQLTAQHQSELEVLALAKDEIIAAMKAQNKELERQLRTNKIPAKVRATLSLTRTASIDN